MKLSEIVNWLKKEKFEFRVSGDTETVIDGFASLENCYGNKLTWIKKKENYCSLSDQSKVKIAVVQEGLELAIPNVIIAENSKEVFFAILHHFWGKKKVPGFIGKGTVIEGNTVIDPSVSIGCNCSIVGDICIGAGTVIENNIVISGKVFIGENCHIQSCTVIGEDGFGYSKDADSGKKTMIEHFGGVRIGNDVFIGSHVNIARGTIDDTVLEDGVKVSPSTHIGHNNYVGENVTVICSNLFGSVKTGSGSYITASTVQNQCKVGENTVIGMGSVVTKEIPDKVIAFGIPAKVVKENNSEL